MSFSRKRLPGFWTFNSTIAPTEFEHIDDYAYAIDGRNGGTYAPSTLLTIGGSGVTVSGPFNASDAKIISVDTTLTIELGAILQLTGNQIVNTGAAIGVQTGAFITVSSGGTFTGNAGSIVDLAGTNTLSGATTISGALTCSNTVALTKGVTVTQSTANTNAITTTGNGTGAGASCTGGATGPGLTAAPGTAQTAATPQKAAEFAGYIQLTGTNPNAGVDPGADNVLHAKMIPKAAVLISSGYAILDGYNVASVTNIAANEYRVTFVRPMANANYGVKFNVHGAPGYLGAHNGTKVTTHFNFNIFKTDTLALGFGAATEAYIEIVGVQ